ncbi:MAG: phosphoribosylamine--glycine ligase [Thermaerobacterales bacterium]
MKVLIIGGGGREHALVAACTADPDVTGVFCLPGSDAIAAQARCLPGDPQDSALVVEEARRHGIDLVLIGPEGPLANGLADDLQAAGVPVFGPTRAAAGLESSKGFAKQFMVRYQIPTAAGEVFGDVAEAEAFVRRRGGPLVVKADGLAGGKGVMVADTTEEALGAVGAAMRRDRFGPAGRRIVIEEQLRGAEISVLAITDGERLVVFPPAQDHKALLDGGLGPNTGGMGAYSPVPFVDDRLLQTIEDTILRPTLAGLKADGLDYRGVLYAGLMLTDEGPRVLEFNCRFGDPEAQVILPRFSGRLAALAASCAAGYLQPGLAAWREEAAVCVVLCSGGYPDGYDTGYPIGGLSDAARCPGVTVYHAGTARRDDAWVTAGGRVVSITAVKPSLAAAREEAYRAASMVRFTGAHYRSDIARAAAR